MIISFKSEIRVKRKRDHINMKSKLIVIEGACDGIGKSTQFALLKERLGDLGRKVVTHHFPSYNTPRAALVESYLKGELGSPDTLSPYLVNTLYATDRALTWKEVISPALDESSVVLLDRYTTSSIIYQSALITDEAEKCAFIDYVTDYEYGKLGVPSPDLVIFLDAPYDTAKALRAARLSNDGITDDIHESSDGFMKSVYDSAQFACDRLKWCRINCADENGAMRSREDIHADVLSAVAEALK